jgi:hypothetical protein
MALDPTTARRTYRTVEPVHAMIYFTPLAHEEYTAIGLRGRRMGYFASRAAALGPAGAEVVTATFFNFNPGIVARAVPAAWELASPADVLAARLRAADRSLREAWGELYGSSAVEEAATLARGAAERACERMEGRPLFAAHASLPWPDDPHLVLWHAQTLLREWRGDGHIALLLAEGLDAVEALVVHAATGDTDAETLRRSRAWDDGTWAAGVERVRARGWLEAGELALSPAGAEHRRSVEARTDQLAAFAYEPLGEEGCERLRAAARPLSRAVVAAGLLAGMPFDDDEG